LHEYVWNNKIVITTGNNPWYGILSKPGLRDIAYENIPLTRDAKLRLFVNIPLLTLSTRIFTWPGVR